VESSEDETSQTLVELRRVDWMLVEDRGGGEGGGGRERKRERETGGGDKKSLRWSMSLDVSEGASVRAVSLWSLGLDHYGRARVE